MNKAVLFCAYKSVLCEGMTLETQYLGSRPTRACELKCRPMFPSVPTSVSRPTRACELKLSPTLNFAICIRHALHGRVS